jgi:3,4-dihydroxy 2-butanone 4-phosphate synthase/GTP cyclohydrolase II
MSMVEEAGRGVVVYVRPQASSMTARHGVGTEETGTDLLDYGTGSQILADLGVRSMVLLTAHPERSYLLEPFGLSISSTRRLD